MKNETEVKLTLERKIVEMIDELKWLEIHGGDPSSVVSLAILQLYGESKDDVEKAVDYLEKIQLFSNHKDTVRDDNDCYGLDLLFK